jgi:hypothetical protein
MVLRCGGSWDCPANQFCCEQLSGTETGTVCATACAGFPLNPQICTTDADCPSQNPTCVLSIQIPGILHCQ